jgi:hypothetical protein
LKSERTQLVRVENPRLEDPSEGKFLLGQILKFSKKEARPKVGHNPTTQLVTVEKEEKLSLSQIIKSSKKDPRLKAWGRIRRPSW